MSFCFPLQPTNPAAPERLTARSKSHGLLGLLRYWSSAVWDDKGFLELKGATLAYPKMGLGSIFSDRLGGSAHSAMSAICLR